MAGSDLVPKVLGDDDVWMKTIHAGASSNVPSLGQRVCASPIMPAFVAALITFIILTVLKPQFVLRKHSSKIALPCIHYPTVVGICVLVFSTVLVFPLVL